ncbi:MAG: redoxin domain-containing protein [Acidobacteria bacterium]|nr:redoxin domain-containing protein [Acidobacteriota bacterium]
MKKFVFFLLALGLIFGSTQLASAQKTTELKGTVVSASQKPLTKAHVRLFSLVDLKKPLAEVQVSSDGSFKLPAPGTGWFTVECTGVDHKRLLFTLLVDQPQPITVSVKLKTNQYVDDYSKLKVITDLDNFSPKGAKSLEKQADGTYAVEFETTKDKVAYQIAGLETQGGTINGTNSDEFEYDGDGDYRSVVKAQNGKVHIVFDPTKLNRLAEPASVVFADKSSSAGKIGELYAGSKRREEAFQTAFQAKIKTKPDIKEMQAFFKAYDESDVLPGLVQSIESEKNASVRQYAMITYLIVKSEKKDKAIAQKALEEIPVSSDLWASNPFLMMTAIDLAGWKDRKEQYIQAIVEKGASSNFKATALFSGLSEADETENEPLIRHYYDRLMKDFGDTQMAQMAKMRFNPDRKVKAGQLLPAFQVKDIENQQVSYSNNSIKGKIYLIDFWAVWCGPCVGEMENLHKAYDKFKGNNFEILSLSFDQKPEDVKKFREEKWKMPWKHAFIEGNFQSELAKLFEVNGIPKPILVDENGKIIAIEGKLRGETLEQTLGKVFADRQNAPK